MSGAREDPTVALTCPNGHPFAKAMSELRRYPAVGCPVCRSILIVDASQFERQARNIERRLKGNSR